MITNPNDVSVDEGYGIICRDSRVTDNICEKIQNFISELKSEVSKLHHVSTIKIIYEIQNKHPIISKIIEKYAKWGYNKKRTNLAIDPINKIPITIQPRLDKDIPVQIHIEEDMDSYSKDAPNRTLRNLGDAEEHRLSASYALTRAPSSSQSVGKNAHLRKSNVSFSSYPDDNPTKNLLAASQYNSNEPVDPLKNKFSSENFVARVPLGEVRVSRKETTQPHIVLMFGMHASLLLNRMRVNLENISNERVTDTDIKISNRLDLSHWLNKLVTDNDIPKTIYKYIYNILTSEVHVSILYGGLNENYRIYFHGTTEEKKDYNYVNILFLIAWICIIHPRLFGVSSSTWVTPLTRSNLPDLVKLHYILLNVFNKLDTLLNVDNDIRGRIADFRQYWETNKSERRTITIKAIETKISSLSPTGQILSKKGTDIITTIWNEMDSNSNIQNAITNIENKLVSYHFILNLKKLLDILAEIDVANYNFLSNIDKVWGLIISNQSDKDIFITTNPNMDLTEPKSTHTRHGSKKNKRKPLRKKGGSKMEIPESDFDKINKYIMDNVILFQYSVDTLWGVNNTMNFIYDYMILKTLLEIVVVLNKDINLSIYKTFEYLTNALLVQGHVDMAYDSAERTVRFQESSTRTPQDAIQHQTHLAQTLTQLNGLPIIPYNSDIMYNKTIYDNPKNTLTLTDCIKSAFNGPDAVNNAKNYSNQFNDPNKSIKVIYSNLKSRDESNLNTIIDMYNRNIQVTPYENDSSHDLKGVRLSDIIFTIGMRFPYAKLTIIDPGCRGVWDKHRYTENDIRIAQQNRSTNIYEAIEKIMSDAQKPDGVVKKSEESDDSDDDMDDQTLKIVSNASKFLNKAANTTSKFINHASSTFFNMGSMNKQYKYDLYGNYRELINTRPPLQKISVMPSYDEAKGESEEKTINEAKKKKIAVVMPDGTETTLPIGGGTRGGNRHKKTKKSYKKTRRARLNSRKKRY